MPRTLFEDLTVSARKQGAASLRALPFSLGVHALAVAAVAFLAVRPAASELSEPPPGTIVFPTNSRPAPAHASAPRVAAPRPEPRHPGSGGTPAPIPIVAPEGVQQEHAGDMPTPVCLTNCGDGAGASGAAQGGGPPDAGAPGGDGDGIGPRPVGGEIRPPVKLHDALPVYPELARRTRVQGLVIVQCVIDETGRVVDARVLKGHFLLDDAALAAVRQWSYEPTRLNGRPIAVFMTVTVAFVQS